MANLRIDGLTELSKTINNDVEVMIEIGSHLGYSTKVFLENVDNLKQLTCIDAWENGYDSRDGISQNCDMVATEKYFDEYIMNNHNNVKKMKMSSTQAAKLIKDKSVDFVYIDACHTYEAVKEDIINYLPKVKDSGWIAGHDIDWPTKETPYFPGVRQAVLEIFGREPQIFCDNSWLFKIDTVRHI